MNGAGADDVLNEPRVPRWNLRRVIGGIVLPIVFTIVLAVFLWRQRDQLEPLWNAPIADLVLIAVLIIIGHFLNSTEFWLLYRADGARSNVFENWFLFLAGQLGNYVPGQVGTVYRLRYMRAVHDVSYTRSAAVYGANFVATLAGAAVVAFIGVIGSAATGNGFSLLMLLVSLGVGGLAVAMALVPLPAFASRSGRLARVWRSFHAGFEQIRRDPRTARSVVALEIAKYFVNAARLAAAFRLLDIHEPFWTYLVLAPAAGIAGFIAITPGAFGFREAFVAAAAAAMGAGLDTGLLGATIDRAVMIATSIVLGSIGFLVTYPRLRSAQAAIAASAQSTTANTT
jgi:uncharacterized membrane protein YbhN (UPF0104 family)